MNNIIDLSNKNIVITGAGSGIGQKTAITLSSLGAKVILLDVSEDGLKKTIESIPQELYDYKVADLTDFEALPDLVKQIVAENGPVAGLVHCAGISSRKPINVLRRHGFEKLMDVNFYSFVELVRLLTKRGNFEDGGSIVAMSSISSIKGYKAKTEYCVSKASVDAFVRCAALELAPKKIRINTIMPGEVLTPMGIKAREMNAAAGNNSYEQPLGPTEPYEVANLIAFLLSDATKTITGTSVVIDGGSSI